MCANTKLSGLASKFGVFIGYPYVFTLFLDQSMQTFGKDYLQPIEILLFTLSSLFLQKLLVYSSGQINKTFAQAYLNR